MSFASTWNKNLAFFRLAQVTNLEYRFNFFTDVFIQPVMNCLIEITLWIALFKATKSQTIAGFGLEQYLNYVMWGAFVSRITANWMYEFRMITEIDSGSVNAILSRPVGFYEYYLSQYLGYKTLSSFFSFLIPLSISLFFGISELSRLPLVLLMVLTYVVFAHTISFCVACLAFFFNRVHSITVAKNLSLWILSGELFPLDIVPEPYRSWLLKLPFSCAVYVPTAFLTGRVGLDVFLRGFENIFYGLLFFGILARILWSRGIKSYAGTGA